MSRSTTPGPPTTRGRHLGMVSLMAVLTPLLVAGCGSEGSGAPAETSTPSAVSAPAETTRVPRVALDDAWTGTTGPRVAIVGDSLTTSGRDELYSELDRYRVKIASAIGEGIGGGPWSTSWGYDVMGRTSSGYLRDEEPPDAFVVALGTNNAWHEELTSEMFEAAWPEMVAEYTGSCLVVVTLSESTDPKGYDSEKAAQINEALVAEADVVVEWGALAQPEHLDDDGIHLSEAGTRYRAQLIREAIDSCGLTEVAAADPEPTN